jgi:hypothetical protein
MKQSASSSRVLGSIVDEFPALAQPAPDVRTTGRVGERLNRLLELNSTRMRVAQIEVMIADLDDTANALKGAIRLGERPERVCLKMSNTAQSVEFNSGPVAQERPKRGPFRYYCAMAIIVVSIPATLAWTAFLFWTALRIVGIL